MTREEAIFILANIDRKDFETETNEALDMAIEALEQEPCEDMTIAYLMGYYADKEPCEDAVSRDELLKAIDTWDKFGVDDTNSLFRLDNLSLPHYVPYIHYDDVIKCIKGMPSVNPQPCDDAISRQAVLDLFEHYCGTAKICNYNQLFDDVKQLPSVRPQEQAGHWIIDKGSLDAFYGEVCKCSECGVESIGESDFCPNCGARMVEPQESEDNG